MNKLFSTEEEYMPELLRLGEMVHSNKPEPVVLERFAALCENEEDAGFSPAFGALRTSLSLEAPEALCVALWLYHDASTMPALTAPELLRHYRRLGGRFPRQSLAVLFLKSGEHVTLHPIAADFLSESPPQLPKGMELLIPSAAPLLHAQQLFNEFSLLLKQYIQYTQKEMLSPLLIAVCGEPGSGRKFLISHLADSIGCSVLKVDLRYNPDAGDIALASALYSSVVCIENPENPEQISGIMARTSLAFAVCGKDWEAPAACGYTLFKREMPPIGNKTARIILREFLTDIPLAPDIAPDREIADLYRLNIGQIKMLAEELKAESMARGGPIDRQIFQRVLRRYGGEHVHGAVRLESSGTLRDLVLPEEQMRQLTELCAFAGQRDTVYKDWCFGEKITWGRGISVLFCGAPGTGKTMAAAVLANEVGLPLMQVDISQLMSKYIGDTQKNIGRIFDEADKSNCILFFDEADALFSKRTEAGDSQDKYSNAETAYLLQRMERYDGICILATNLLQNFDEAFRRRIGYMLHFPLPDEKLRERIWRGIFPEKAPVEELDYALLARNLELSGASIRNSAIHAAYLAAVNHTSITMRYILAGAKNEYAKQGRTLNPQTMQLLAMYNTDR